MSDTKGERRITPVILSGGAGTRLWPLSRRLQPKQMLTLGGERTMLQLTAARVADRTLFEAPVIVAGADQAEAVADQLRAGGTAPGMLILEPAARNTAAAVALAALAAEADDLLLVMPSDHLIGDPARFVDAVRTAVPLAGQDWLVTFGVRPDRPETGYGYIRRGEALGPGLFRAMRFVEKPDLATAETFLADGGYDWNAGIFLFRAGAFLEALATHASDIAAQVGAAMDRATREEGVVSPDATAFEAVRAQSIDRAVMEHADRIAVVPVDMQWSDVGSWQALFDASPKDGDSNALSGEVVALDSRGCLIRSDGPLVVAVGIEDLAVIATGDAVLIVPRDRAQRVQDAVALLAKRGDPRV